MTTSLTACAEEDRVVFHSFGYDLTIDSPGVDLLAYKYGDAENEIGVKDEVKPGVDTLNTSHGTTGKMPLGDFLYVKWRDKSTQQVFEDRVDLKHRLPSPKVLRGSTVYFLVDDNQLYVYLIPDRDLDSKRNYLPAGKSPNGPQPYSFLDVQTLHPANEPPKVRGGRK